MIGMSFVMDSIITLFSSDSRPRYEKDIFNIVALPINSTYRFRYRAEYISKNIIPLINSKGKKEILALIAFRTNKGVDNKDVFITPIRWAVIKNIQRIEKFYCFDFVVKQFVKFNPKYENAKDNQSQINKIALEYFGSSEKDEIFVSDCVPDIIEKYVEREEYDSNKRWISIIKAWFQYPKDEKEECDSNKRWISIIEALFQYPKFENRFFLKSTNLISLDILEKLKKCPWKLSNYKPAVVREGKRIYFQLDYFNDKVKETEESKINIGFDNTLLIPTGDYGEIIESSYDSNTYGFQAKKVLGSVQTQITITHVVTTNKNNEIIRTQIKLPLTIERNIILIWLRFIVTLFGVGLVGLAGILPACTPFSYKLVLFVLGTLITSANWFFPYKE